MVIYFSLLLESNVIEWLSGYLMIFNNLMNPCLFQDDHPPIPDSLSPAITDFLRQCFKKVKSILFLYRFSFDT